MRWRRPELWLAFVLWLVTAAAYLPTLGHDFVPIDDPQYVSENGRLASGLTREGLVRAFTERYFENWTPLTTLSYAVDYRLHGLWAGGYLLTNLLLHATAASLLFLTLVRMTGALGRSGFVAGLFALHPLHVEAVAWVAERKEVLSGVFFAATLWCYARYAENRSGTRYGAVALCLALGLLAKPMLVTVPFVLLLLDLWPLGRVPLGSPRAAPASVARLTLEKAPLFFLSAVSSVITFRVQEAAGTIQTMEQVPLVLRLVNIPLAYAWYLEKTFWPVGLAFYYPLFRGSISLSNAGLTGAALGVVTLCTVALLWRAPYVTVGWLWFLGMLVPVIGFVQVGSQAYADRYSYLPLIGIGLAVAWGAHDFAAQFRIPAARLSAAALALLALLLVATELQIRVWQDGITLGQHALSITAPTSTAHTVLATTLCVKERAPEAREHALEAIRLDPRAAGPRVILGLVLERYGMHEEASEELRQALRLDPRSVAARIVLGKILVDMGRHTEALTLLSQTLAAGPEGGEFLIELYMGDALAGQGKVAEAIEHYRRTLHWRPDSVPALAGLGAALTQMGQLADGEEALRRAVALSPKTAEIQGELAENLQRQRRITEAVAYLREALRLRPGQLEATNNLAWLLATATDPSVRSPAEAVALAEEAAMTTRRGSAAVLDTLAAAYASAGRLTDATATANEALALARQAGQDDLAREIGEHARAYQAGSVAPAAGEAAPPSS